jgi:hypothetical protein
MKTYFLFNESLITRARNYCVDEFLRSDATHLMFIDSDIGFNPHDVIGMLALQSDDSPYDVLCGPYPKKNISWEKIKLAVDKGVADEDASKLDEYVGDFVFNPVIEPGASKVIHLGEPAEIMEAGTGFMMIRRELFTRYKEAYPDIMYRPDHVRSAEFDGSREIGMYFQAAIDEKSKRYLSEDYWFCQKARAFGAKIWLCPWMRLQHVGSYIFAGSLQALASIGASPTADPSKLGKQQVKNPEAMNLKMEPIKITHQQKVIEHEAIAADPINPEQPGGDSPVAGDTPGEQPPDIDPRAYDIR